MLLNLHFGHLRFLQVSPPLLLLLVNTLPTNVQPPVVLIWLRAVLLSHPLHILRISSSGIACGLCLTLHLPSILRLSFGHLGLLSLSVLLLLSLHFQLVLLFPALLC